MSSPRIYQAVIDVATQRAMPDRPPALHVDIGAGRGELLCSIGAAMPVTSVACDFHVERFAAIGPVCTQVDLDREPLPYDDAAFDLVTCCEVIEHLENFRGLLRESFRVTAPGGMAIFTTPNVLNAGSRARYLVSGFATLFGPLPLRNDRRSSTGGHITPIPYFYLAHALMQAGFDDVEVAIDRVQRKSLAWLVLLAPLIFFGRLRFLRRERRRYETLTPHNERHVRSHFSWTLLVGRTIVVSARKPPCAA